MFAWTDKGIYYFAGEGDDARIVRSVVRRTPSQPNRIAPARPQAARDAAGTLTGHALGDGTRRRAGAGFDLLADILAVVRAQTRRRCGTRRIVARLAELRPDVYARAGRPEQLTAALKPYGITTGQIWGTTEDGKGDNRRGITRADITAAVTERDENRDAG